MAKERNTERDLWLVVIGGMLANESFRKEASLELTPDDCPDSKVSSLFNVIVGGKHEFVYEQLEGWGVENGDEKAIQSVLKRVKWLALKWMTKRLGEGFGTLMATSDPKEVVEMLRNHANRIEERL